MSGTRVTFEKWEGLGNDFVVVEADAATWSDERVRAVCDRRFGVGADGVLFVSRGAAGAGARRAGATPLPDAGRTPLPDAARTPLPDAALPRMVVRNADGSRPEMCGNGIRCVAGYLRERAQRVAIRFDEGAEGLPIAAGVIEIATDAGPKRCEVTGAEGAFDVSVAMGPARVEGELTVAIDGRAHAFVKGDVGNPHAITFEAYDEAAIDRVGPRVATAPEGGTNVEFCTVVKGEDGRPSRVDVIVWERGVGRTLACGTGACAVASAACAAGSFAYGAPVRVRLPGGELVVTVERGSWEATMRGPARRVFTGELEIH